MHNNTIDGDRIIVEPAGNYIQRTYIIETCFKVWLAITTKSSNILPRVYEVFEFCIV